MTEPRVGDRVLYRLSDADRKRVGAHVYITVGDDPLPMDVVQARGYIVDGHVLMPGQRPSLYVMSVPKGVVAGTWSVPVKNR